MSSSTECDRRLPSGEALNTRGLPEYRATCCIVDFLTTKEVQETEKSHLNYVVADTEEWEQGVAKRLEKTCRDFWIPAVNNSGTFGVWAILEVQDIHETQGLIRVVINNIISKV